jgi:hypothetical protein
MQEVEKDVKIPSVFTVCIHHQGTSLIYTIKMRQLKRRKIGHNSGHKNLKDIP